MAVTPVDLSVTNITATRAQALLQINGGTARPDVIAVILGSRLESAQDHIAALGLTQIEQELDAV